MRALDVRVVMVTFEEPAAAAAYSAETGTDFPVVIDARRELYRGYGAHKAKLRHLVGPTTLAAYAREALAGVFPRRPVADTTQQGADVLVDPTGVVRFHHVGAGSGYRPGIDEILQAVSRVSREP